MSAPVKDGDEITVVDFVLLPARGVLNPLIHARMMGPTFVNGSTRRRTFRWFAIDRQREGWTADDEEGVVWIRGHHAVEVPEALALIAARSLA